jgi:hypothetical protein
MTGVIRKATLLVVLGLVAASVALAGIPDPGHSTVPAFVNLVACDGAGALTSAYPARYQATVTVHDIGGFPVVGSLIRLSFCSDVRIYSVIPGGTVTGSVYTHGTLTNGSGQATVEISGAGLNSTGASFGADGLNCVTWTADGYTLGTSSVSAYDENGGLNVALQNVDATDLTRFAQDYLAVPSVYKPRSDFNNILGLDGGDLTFFAQYFLALPPFDTSCGTLN